jgi:hypothetical protein
MSEFQVSRNSDEHYHEYVKLQDRSLEYDFNICGYILFFYFQA